MELINGVLQSEDDGLILEIMAKYPPYYKSSDRAKWPRINGRLGVGGSDSGSSSMTFSDFTSSYTGVRRTVTDANGLLKTLPASVVAIDHVGPSLTPMLRLEPAGTNLLFGSNTFTAPAGWTLSNVTGPATPDAIGPDGTLSAWTMVDASAANTGALGRSIVKSTSDSTTYFQTVLGFAKTVGATTFPSIGMSFSGGTIKYALYTVNTNAGTLTAASFNSAANMGYFVREISGFWIVYVWSQDPAAGANSAVTYQFNPAINADASGTWVAATQGSCVIANAKLTTGNIPSSYFAGAAAIGAELVTGGAFTAHATGAVTQANMRLSAVDGTAFVDFSAADLLTDHLGKILTIKDSAGKVLVGYIKAAGTGETYTELVTDVGFDNPGAWNIGANWAVAASKATATGAAAGTYIGSAKSHILHSLYKWTIDCDSIAAGVFQPLVDGQQGATFTTPGPKTYYRTSIVGGIRFGGLWSNTLLTAVFDNISIGKVLAPSATGVTIVSTPGGTVFNWTYQQTGFNYNDAADYTYEIYNTNFEYGTGWYPSGNKAVKIAGTASDLTQTTAAAEVGKVYRVGNTAVRTAGTLTPEFGSTDGAVISANGTYYDYSIAADTDYLKFKADAAFAGSVDVATVKEHGTVRLSEAGTVTLAMPAAVAALLADTGTIVVKGQFAFARAAGVVTAILSAQDATASLAYTTTTAGNLTTYDGTTIAESAGAYTANVDWKIAITFPSNTNKYRIGVDVNGAGIVQGTEAAFDGAFTATANLILGRVLHGATWIGYIKFFDNVLTNPQINAIK